MNLKESLAKLESLCDEKRRAFNIKNGAGNMKQFGVAMGAVRMDAKLLPWQAFAMLETEVARCAAEDGR